MPNPVAEVVSRLRSIGGPTREEAADLIERQQAEIEAWRDTAKLFESQSAEIERLSRERDTGVPEGCRLTFENVTQLESILAAASHQQWEWTTFTKPDGSPIVSVEDVAKTTAASARRGAGVELHGITPAGLAPDAEGPNVICYTGNGDGSAANARAIVSLWMAAPDLLKIARAMLSAAPQPPTVSEGASSDLPDEIYVERDADTNEKRWFSCKGMGEKYVHARLLDNWKFVAKHGLAKVTPEHTWAQWLAEMEADLSTLTRERDQAREALAPFAKVLDAMEHDNQLCEEEIDSVLAGTGIVPSDLRRARSVLHPDTEVSS